MSEGNTTSNQQCEHDRLRFGSGDYYLFCQDCRAHWVLHGWDRPEYGIDKDGKPIGADSTLCNPGPLKRQLRVGAADETAGEHNAAD